MGIALADFGRDSRSNDSLRGVVLSKKRKKILTKFPGLATSGRHNSVMIANAENLRPNGPPTGISSFHFYRQNHFKALPMECTLRTRKGLTQIFGNVRCPILSNSVLVRPSAIDMTLVVNFIRQVNWQQIRKRINIINTKKKRKKTNNV